jgi:antitoxin Phd
MAKIADFHGEGSKMAMLTYRNSQGKLVDISSIPATRIKNEFGNALETASRGGAVAITRHDKPKAVLISYEDFQSLVNLQSQSLDSLAGEFEELLGRMQTPASRKGMAAAFDASPAELGRAAVRATQRRKKT